MSRASLYRILFWMAVSAVLAIIPPTSLAQHGGHAGVGFHGGGGFHGGTWAGHGGGFGSFQAGRGFTGFNSRGGLGFHNGTGFGGVRKGLGFSGFAARGFHRPFYRGFRGGYGYPYGITLNFGFAPYWDIYPYWVPYPYSYGYGPWWPAPYLPDYYHPDSSPYDSGDADDRCGPDCDSRGTDRCLPDYRHEDRCKDEAPATSEPKRESAPTQPSNTESSPNREYVSSNSEQDYRTSLHAVAWGPSTGNLDAAASTKRSAEIRPAVLNAIQALRAMPPAARLRQVKSDRYADFSPQERELLDEASKPDLGNNQ